MATPKSTEFVKIALSRNQWAGPVIELGAGNTSKFYRPFFKGQKYVTLDQTQQPDGSIDIHADILNMPQVESDFYGVVLLCDVLEHLYNPFQAFREAARILRPRGLFICTTVAAWPLHKHPFDFYRFLPDGLAHLCIVSGLKIIYGYLEPITKTCGQACCVAAIKE
jgi:2-polyprenyl-3-methyl-5-hydroxy-6-metoxy-1,4-benzoquinol methylase